MNCIYKKIKYLLNIPIIIFFLLTSAGCSIFNLLEPYEEWKTYKAYIGHERPFYGMQYDANSSNPRNVLFNSRCVWINDYLEIYLENNISYSPFSESEKKIQEIAEYYSKYFKEIENIYGTLSDVDHNKKLIMLICSIQNESNGAYIAGYFNPRDLLRLKNSNGSEIIYINKVQFEGSFYRKETIMDTIFHELQHAINYNKTLALGTPSCDIWLNEALSESTYFIHSQDEQPSPTRIIYFNHPNSPIHKNGEYFYSWNGNVSSYSTASIFMYWLYIQSKDGKGILKYIAQYRGGMNYNAIVSAAKQYISPSLSSWDAILSTWLRANYENSKDKPLLGYKGRIKLDVYEASKGSVKILPGGALYTKDTSVLYTHNPSLTVLDLSDGMKVVYNPSTTINGPSYEVNIIKESLSPRRASKPIDIRSIPIDVIIDPYKY